MVSVQKRIIVRIAFFITVLAVTVNMGDKDKSAGVHEPGFAKLAEGEGSFRAIVYDENNQYTIKNFSFFGHVTVGGVRRETDDSVTRFELSKIKELKVLSSHFDSKRFGDKDFLLAEVTSATGAVTSDLLVPKKIVICGIDEKSGLEKSWFMHKINRFVVQGVTPLVLPSIPSVITGNADNHSAVPAPLTSVAQAPPSSPALPTGGSQEKTKRTFRPSKENKWDAFYNNNQIPSGPHESAENKKGISGAFIGIIDAIIDFVRAIINGILHLFR